MFCWRRGRDSNPRYGVNRTHDFQSCTFNRSVTSPLREIGHLASLPCSINGQTAQSVSSEHFLTNCPTDSPTYHSKISVAKSKSEFQKNSSRSALACRPRRYRSDNCKFITRLSIRLSARLALTRQNHHY